LSNKLKILVNSVLNWWEEHKNDQINIGDEETDNLFDSEPEFVTIAKKLKES
jgi:hypothetical protein